MKNMVSCNAACKATMLSMGSLKPLLRESVFTVLDLNEMCGTTSCVFSLESLKWCQGEKSVCPFGCGL